MSYATIMVHVGDDVHADARLKLAAKLADRFDSALVGFAAEERRPLFVTDGIVADGEVADRENKEIVDRLAAKEKHFRDLVAGAQQQVDWRAAVGDPAATLAAEMRAADLAILGRGPSSADTFRVLDPAAAMLRLGRPTLLVPGGIDSLAARNVVIGWRDTRECRRAVADALPFLQEADSVRVVELCSLEEHQNARARIDDVVHYLTRHQVKARSEVVRPSKDTIAEELVAFAQQHDADLIVTGAYGHSRFGEWIFGGVTYDLLAMSPVCCLMSH